MSTRLKSWMESRLHLEDVKHVLAKKVVPVHRHTVWYYLGGMASFLLLIQFVTGILLLFYYKPSEDSAFESVRYIMTEVEFGWLIRSIHSWSANLLIAVLFVHMFSVFFLRAYRKPRELTWVSGSLLLFVCMGFGFTGYLLPWNKLALFATKVGTEIAGAVPLIGDWVLGLLRGGEEVTGATLNRFFAIHVWVLPVFLVALLGLHLVLVQKHGMSVPLGQEGRVRLSIKFLPNFLLRDMVGWLVALAVLVALAAVFPWELGEKADPFAPAPAGIKPEWYFLFMFQALKLLPAKIGPVDGEIVGVLGMGALGVLLVLVPFLDRRASQGRRSPLFTWLGLAALVFIVAMTLWGLLG
jgi:cytochrome b6